jgi:hypothetical protein
LTISDDLHSSPINHAPIHDHHNATLNFKLEIKITTQNLQTWEQDRTHNPNLSTPFPNATDRRCHSNFCESFPKPPATITPKMVKLGHLKKQQH